MTPASAGRGDAPLLPGASIDSDSEHGTSLRHTHFDAILPVSRFRQVVFPSDIYVPVFYGNRIGYSSRSENRCLAVLPDYGLTYIAV